jgi:hypothetical protein
MRYGAKPTVHDGVEYPSRTALARELKMSRRVLGTRIAKNIPLDDPILTRQQACAISAKNDELKKFRPELLSKGMTVDQGMVALQIILERNK